MNRCVLEKGLHVVGKHIRFINLEVVNRATGTVGLHAAIDFLRVSEEPSSAPVVGLEQRPVGDGHVAGAEKGTLQCISVPPFGFDRISTVPPTSVNRSRILIRPKPRFFIAVSGSKPTPSSRTKR